MEYGKIIGTGKNKAKKLKTKVKYLLIYWPNRMKFSGIAHCTKTNLTVVLDSSKSKVSKKVSFGFRERSTDRAMVSQAQGRWFEPGFHQNFCLRFLSIFLIFRFHLFNFHQNVIEKYNSKKQVFLVLYFVIFCFLWFDR